MDPWVLSNTGFIPKRIHGHRNLDISKRTMLNDNKKIGRQKGQKDRNSSFFFKLKLIFLKIKLLNFRKYLL